MKLESIKLKALVIFFAALALPMTFAACGGDDDEDGDDKDKTEQGGGNGGNTDTDKDKDARALAVTIDESALTYEDYTIEQSGEVLIEFKQVPFGKVKVSLEDLPTSVAELKKLKLPNGMTDIHQSPYLTPALLVAALNQLNYDKTEAQNMIDYIVKEVKSENRDAVMVHFPGKGSTQIYKSEWNQLKQYTDFNKVRSFFEGTSYYNNYTPTSKPWVMTMELTNYSYTADPDYVQLWLTSTSLKDSKGNPIPREYGIWKYDSNGDGKYDYFFGSTFLQLAHSMGSY